MSIQEQYKRRRAKPGRQSTGVSEFFKEVRMAIGKWWFAAYITLIGTIVFLLGMNVGHLVWRLSV